MTALLFLPIYLLTFWFGEAPIAIIKYFGGLNKTYFQFFSVPILLRTFFKPVKNEYRKGLIGFSIAMGMFLKSSIILTSLLLFIPLFILELLFLIGFLIFPLLTVAMIIW